MTDGSYQEGLLREWVEKNAVNAQILTFDGYDPLMAALDAGQLDAITTPDLASSYDYLSLL